MANFDTYSGIILKKPFHDFPRPVGTLSIHSKTMNEADSSLTGIREANHCQEHCSCSADDCQKEEVPELGFC